MYFSSFTQHQKKLTDDRNESCQLLKDDTALNQQHVLKFHYEMKCCFQQFINEELKFILFK